MKIFLVFFCAVGIFGMNGFKIDEKFRKKRQEILNFETKTLETFEIFWFGDLSEAENAEIFYFFTGDLNGLNPDQILVLRQKWDQLKVKKFFFNF